MMPISDVLHVARGLRCYFVTMKGTHNSAFEVFKGMDEVSEGLLRAFWTDRFTFILQNTISPSHGHD
jgi:hypothetical protein